MGKRYFSPRGGIIKKKTYQGRMSSFPRVIRTLHHETIVLVKKHSFNPKSEQTNIAADDTSIFFLFLSFEKK